MNKLILNIIMGILLLSSLSFAESKVCYTEEPCNFLSVIYNTTENYYNATNVINSLVNQNGTVIYEDKDMNEIDTGRYSYNYTIEEAGTYLRETIYDDIYKSTEEIIVEDFSTEDSVGMSISNSNLLYILIFGLLIGIFIYIKKGK